MEKTKDELREIIRENLVDLRKKKGVSQLDLSIIVDKKSSSVASWEQGISLPDVTTLYRLSIYYNVAMEFFYKKHNKEGEEE
ncbi:MAG: helix-turn-helix transcriptional regulator [Mogibacterium sp.]|nr:helix-turn-helix transcriptional regulator [Mogibacterium sp.]